MDSYNEAIRPGAVFVEGVIGEGLWGVPLVPLVTWALAWCPAAVGFQVRVFALQAAVFEVIFTLNHNISCLL